MNTHDLDGTAYQNERRAFYAPQKEADVGTFSYAYRWISDGIGGTCSELTRDKLLSALPSLELTRENSHFPVDTIVLDPAALFLTGSDTLSKDGVVVLAQVKNRLKGYKQLIHLSVEGHTDSRASKPYNQALSQRRAALVATELESLVGDDEIRSIASGENKPFVSGVRPLALARNRRVSIVAIVAREESVAAPIKTLSVASVDSRCRGEGTPSEETIMPMTETELESRIARSIELVFDERPPLSAGDRIRMTIPEGEELTGIYEVGIGGSLEIPYLGLVQAQGLDTRTLESTIHDRLIEEEIFQRGMLRVATTVQEWAPVDVLVSGATFDPGRVTINRQKAEFRTFKQGHLSGDFAKERLLSAALFSAGGIRPDADLQNIQLIRNGAIKYINLRGLFDGKLTKDVPLASGDQIIVPTLGYFQSDLVRRSQITPPGIRIFISNLSVPAQSNSQSAVNSSATSVPYGTRFLQGLISANCVGGTQLTNASRRVVLISVNPLTGRTEVIERSVQQLISDPHRDDINPFLMPNDGIACYDSGVTNFRDVTRTFSEFLSPLLDLQGF